MSQISIRNAHPSEFSVVGDIMVKVYAELKGFPTPQQQPAYYQMLANIGNLTNTPGTELLVAVDTDQRLLGGVVYFDDMKNYGSGGSATKEKHAAGFRLLAVDPQARGQGIGKMLSKACISKAKQQKQTQLIIHTTDAMQVAWSMYEKLGFTRAPGLDFNQQGLPVYGFRLSFAY